MATEPAPTVIKRIKLFFAGSTASVQRRRSGAGLLLTLVLLPVLLGVLACLPVPVGDPEKSHIDPAMSGVWTLSAADGDHMLMVLDPYDKRTWLMSLIDLGGVADSEPGASAEAGQDGSEPEDLSQERFSTANADRFKVKSVGLYKCWLTSIKGETFMTWESKNLSETLPAMLAKEWWVFRVRKSAADSFYLDGFDEAVDGLNEVKTRKEAEKIIRRHIRDPGFFGVEDALRLDRVPESDLDALSRLLENFGISDSQ